MERTQNISLRTTARIAGGFYLLAVATAVLGEAVFHGTRNHTAGLIAVACYAVVTLLLYIIFSSVNSGVAMIAAICNFVGLIFEALHLNPQGTDVAMIFHGVFCILIGWLILRSRLMPKLFGALLVLAGFDWLLNLSPQLINRLSPWNSAVGLICEGLPFLWLLIMGVRNHRIKRQI